MVKTTFFHIFISIFAENLLKTGYALAFSLLIII